MEEEFICGSKLTTRSGEGHNYIRVNDMILNKTEDLLFTGGEDPYINLWGVDYLNNELTFLYNLDSKTITIYSFSFNDSENLLISCSVCEYIIWEKQESNKWEYLCNEKMESYFQVKFTKDNYFCVLPINQQISCIFIYQIQKRVLNKLRLKQQSQSKIMIGRKIIIFQFYTIN